MNAAAPWQRSRCMLSWALCVSKFAVVSLHWDLWAVFRGFFCTIDMRAAPALPAILLASIASFSRYGSSWDACVPELSAFLNLRLEVAQESCGRPFLTTFLHVGVCACAEYVSKNEKFTKTRSNMLQLPIEETTTLLHSSWAAEISWDL